MKFEHEDDVTPVEFEGRKYMGIKELGINERGGFVINLHNCLPDEKGRRGGYCTVLPISPLSYRKDHPTNTSYMRTYPTRIVVSDDHGSPHTITAPVKVIDILEIECELSGIPEV